MSYDYDNIEEPTERTRTFGGFYWEASDRVGTTAPTKADLRYKRGMAIGQSHGTRGRKPKPSWKP